MMKNIDREQTREEPKKWIYIMVSIFAVLVKSITFSFQSPLYPPEAEQKGLTPSVYSTVMGFFRFATLLFCPLIGLILEKVGVKNMLFLGLFLNGLSAVMFGLLKYVDNYTGFIFLSLISRTTEAIGSLGLQLAVAVIITIVFSDKIATVLAFVESAILVGLSIGPALGEILFELGGFSLPFILLGLISIIFTMVNYLFFPNPVQEGSQKIISFQHHAQNLFKIICKLFKVPSLLFFLTFPFTVVFTIDFLFAILEPNLRQFELSHVQTGLIIMELGIGQLSGPIWGYLLDKHLSPELVAFIGCIFNMAGLMFLGPISFVAVKTTVIYTSIGLTLVGIGLPALILSTFSKLVKIGKAHGEADKRITEISTYTIIASLFIIFGSLGGIFGAPAAGSLFDNFGFKNALLLPYTIYLILSIISLFFMKNESDVRASSGENILLIEENLDLETTSLLNNKKFFKKANTCDIY